MQRITQYPLLKEIQERWSARAFSTRSVQLDDLYALIEAASLAPSAMNEQPWRFILGDKPDDLSILKQSLFVFHPTGQSELSGIVHRVKSQKCPTLHQILIFYAIV